MSAKGPCLSSPARISNQNARQLTHSFTVHIRHLLDLESTLQARSDCRQYIFDATPTLITTAHNQQRLLLGKGILGKLLQSLVHHQDTLDLRRNLVKTINDLLTSSRLANGVVGELESNHDEGDILRGVRLGRGNTDLGTSVDVHTAVGLTRKGRLELASSRIYSLRPC
jgi:hypothetical protein